MAAKQTMLTDEGTEGGEEEFEDAKEVLPMPEDWTLSSMIDQTRLALHLFLNNRFSEAKNRMEPYADRSMYHALGHSTILYIQAVMTFDMQDIEQAIQALKKAIAVCDGFRHKFSMLESLSKARSRAVYNDLTEVEIHAELCYAECLLLRALLSFVQDENLLSFVKGGLKIRECYKIYKECNKMMERPKFTEEKQKSHFETGVKMGVGTFNLMISLLPSKILKLLEFVGFSGNKVYGLKCLSEGSYDLSSLRGPLCSIIMMAYHTVVCYILGLADGDISYAAELLKPCLEKYPKGALFLFFDGRIEEVRGNIDKAIVKFEESIECQQEWRQFHHLAYWELMWCHCFKGDWLMAMKYAEKLCKESRWSKATYTYQKAAFLMMCEDQTDETRAHIQLLFKDVPKLKQRIAGKSIPIEKFSVHKVKRFLEHNTDIVLPALELVYVWNGFSILGKREELVDPVLTIVESTINTILKGSEANPFYHDNYALVILLKGACLKCKGQYMQAEQCFKEVLEREKLIKHDTYLVPYTTVELALLYLKLNDKQQALHYLDQAKKNYKGYLLESRLHFRIHAVRLQLNSSQNGKCVSVEQDLDSDARLDEDSTPVGILDEDSSSITTKM
ncbi:tetratricopeptide repeat protein 39B-like [Ostrea edulis]|uniref:tetratricopeptide repeat protein 39B-like n=1 Tax=Ostrea edulis TaxID=37623 RepID=UPI0020961EAB|nr:tetratricopeptide repeat protein 39B-like [Ostrea edulis]